MNNDTLRKLRDMRLTGMSELYEELQTNSTYQELTSEDFFNLLVDREYSRRKTALLDRLIKQARLSDPTACIEDIEYHEDRHLDAQLIAELAAGNYIEQSHNLIIMGASGNGKSWIANALGIQACRQFRKVKYMRLPELLDELAVAKHAADGSFRKLITKYKKIDLLIIDEWLLTDLSLEGSTYILEIIDARIKKASTIFCSQFAPEGWHAKLSQIQIADAILDRIVHDSYHLLIDGDVSMRERHGIRRQRETIQTHNELD
ncbi:IS21-like element helper ATPase IstB [Vagococcus sp. BWB3-3]|uniref:IS21-like element helper ATPase IstB n=1 Tax=Vagococcus allomyrinae TaxID=2794353 RepID=A0A940PF96_9ENTE|nr:IS21-like element helper ATPase IstB [Vagococcus allomyrinae]MBP1042903.1 IS21-like element helper ATPase IstB [Vagococcus allomyrinae]